MSRATQMIQWDLNDGVIRGTPLSLHNALARLHGNERQRAANDLDRVRGCRRHGI